MAKDPASGPVSKPEGGHYESSDEIRAEDSGLTRSEIINNFGEDLGGKLLDGGYSSLSGMMGVPDEDFLAIKGIGPAALAKIREVVSLEVAEDEGGQDEKPASEEAVEEAAVEAVEAVEEVGAEAQDEEVGEEVLPGEPPTAPAPPPLAAGTIGPRPADEVPPWGTEGAMSVRVRRNKEAAAREEAERKRRAVIEDAHYKPPFSVPDLGSVDVDFVPEPDPETDE